MKKLYFIYTLMMLTDHCICEEEKKVSLRLTDVVILCSSVLSTALYRICDKKIAVLKRDTSPMMDKLMSTSMQEYRRSKRMIVEERRRRVRRQVAEECCDNPCAIATIIQYCADNSRLVKEEPELFNR